MYFSLLYCSTTTTTTTTTILFKQLGYLITTGYANLMDLYRQAGLCNLMIRTSKHSDELVLLSP